MTDKPIKEQYQEKVQEALERPSKMKYRTPEELEKDPDIDAGHEWDSVSNDNGNARCINCGRAKVSHIASGSKWICADGQTLEKLTKEFEIDRILPRELIVYDKDRNVVPAMYKRVKVND